MQQIRQTDDNKITALYERLSKDDDFEGDSNSIVHQKEMVLSNQVRNFGLRLPCHAACLSSDLSESSLRYPLVTDQSSEYSIRYTVTSRR